MERVEPSKKLDAIVQQVIGAAIEVHRFLGPGFLESTYEEAMCVELRLRNISFIRQLPVAVKYKGHLISQNRMDLFVEDELIVELKAVDLLAPINAAQVLSYLRATGCHVGLLINFNVQLLKQGIRRIVLS